MYFLKENDEFKTFIWDDKLKQNLTWEYEEYPFELFLQYISILFPLCNIYDD